MSSNSLISMSSPSDFNWEDYHLLREAIQTQNKKKVLHLVQSGVQVNNAQCAYFCHSPLHLAVISRCVEIVEILLAAGADIGAKDWNDDSPLTLAAKTENRDLIRAILLYNVQNHENIDQLSHLHVACMGNNIRVVRKLILCDNGKNINRAVGKTSLLWPSYTPLHFAVHFGCTDAVAYLLKCGADITAKDSRELTPLQLADLQRNEQIIDILLEAHKDEFTNPQGPQGISHFHIACSRNNISVVDHFLKLGVDVNSERISDDQTDFSQESLVEYRSNGWKPVHFAMYYGCTEVIECLLRANANLRSCIYPHLIRQLCRRNSYLYLSTIMDRSFLGIEREEKFQHVQNFVFACRRDYFDRSAENPLDTGVISANTTFQMGYTPLHLAAKYNAPEIVGLLFDHGANIVNENYKGETSIHIAFKSQHWDIFDLLIEQLAAQAENVSDCEGLSIFHMLCTTTNLEVINDFIHNGVDVNARVSMESGRWAGYTALHFACLYKRIQTIELLVQQNADVFSELGMTPRPIDLIFKSLSVGLPSDQCGVLTFCAMVLKSLPEEAKQIFVEKISPLHLWAALRAHVQAQEQEFIVKYHNSIDIVMSLPEPCKYSECTPLHFTMIFENFDKAKLLLENGANPFLKNFEGRTPLEFWFDHNKPFVKGIPSQTESCFMLGTPLQGLKPRHFHIACTLGFLDAVRCIMDNISDEQLKESFVNYRDKDFCTPLHSVLTAQYVKSSITEIVRILLDNGADVNARDCEGKSPLYYASRCEHFHDLNLLIRHGARVNTQNLYGETPLHVLISSSLEVKSEGEILTLLESGTDINIVDECGRTCLNYLDYDLETHRRRGEQNETRRNKVLLFCRHLKKLQVIGRYVSERNMEKYYALRRGHYLGNGHFDEESFIRECEKELELMESVNVDRYTTLKATLFKSIHEMAVHCENVHLQELIESENFSERYPIYGFLVRLQMKHGRSRRSLLLESKSSLTNVIQMRLPQSCLEAIFQYFSNADLANIISSCGKSNVEKE